MFENRVLSGIVGHRRDKVTGEWRKLHNVALNGLYCSPNIVRVIKLRRMMGGICRAYWGEERRMEAFDGET